VGGLARGDSRYTRMLKSLARMQVLILDDWGITPLTAEQRRDLLEIFNDRHGRASGIGHFGASAPHKLRVNSPKYHKSWENSPGSGDLPDSDRPMTNLIRGLMTPLNSDEHLPKQSRREANP
jgi:hypothetical protein